MMRSNLFLGFVGLLLATVSYGLKINIIKTIAKATESLVLATEVKNALTELVGGNSNNDQEFDVDRLVAELGNLIDTAKMEILSAIVLRSKLDRVDDAVIAIQSSLMDIKNVLEAQTGADELLELFVKRYEEHEVIKHVRFLKVLLSYVSPGDNVDLITLVREGTRCGNNAMNDFRRFYLDLLLDGALLEISYLTHVTQNVDIQSSVDKWADVVVDTDKIFADQISLCDARFPDDIQVDFDSTNDPTELKDILDDRYADKIIDILFFSGTGTNQFLAYRHPPKDKSFFWNRDLGNINKMLVVTETDGKASWDKASTTSALEKCKEGITKTDKTDANLAQNVLKYMISCPDLRYRIGTIIVYFESDKFETKAVTLHPDSPVIELSIDGVKIEYCYEWKCVFAWIPGTQIKQQDYGRLRIFVYPILSDDLNHSDFATGVAGGGNPSVWLLIVAAIAWVALLLL